MKKYIVLDITAKNVLILTRRLLSAQAVKQTSEVITKHNVVIVDAQQAITKRKRLYLSIDWKTPRVLDIKESEEEISKQGDVVNVADEVRYYDNEELAC